MMPVIHLVRVQSMFRYVSGGVAFVGTPPYADAMRGTVLTEAHLVALQAKTKRCEALLQSDIANAQTVLFLLHYHFMYEDKWRRALPCNRNSDEGNQE